MTKKTAMHATPENKPPQDMNETQRILLKERGVMNEDLRATEGSPNEIRIDKKPMISIKFSALIKE